MPEFELTKAASFEAAHYFPESADARQRQMHGHSFRLEVTIAGAVGADGRVEDFTAFAKQLETLASRLDHGCLNEIAGLELPTLEHLCVWVAEQLQPIYNDRLRAVSVSRPSLEEVCVLRL